jgi:hypothetical protein
MPRIVEDCDVCTVIVTVDAAPELMSTLAAHASLGIERFPEFPGFLGGALHISSDQGRLVQYLQWASESEYLACLNDPIWDEPPSTQFFLKAVHSGGASLDARIFRVVTSSEGYTHSDS